MPLVRVAVGQASSLSVNRSPALASPVNPKRARPSCPVTTWFSVVDPFLTQAWRGLCPSTQNGGVVRDRKDRKDRKDHDGPPIIPIRPIFSDPPSFRSPTSEFSCIIKFARSANIFPDTNRLEACPTNVISRASTSQRFPRTDRSRGWRTPTATDRLGP